MKSSDFKKLNKIIHTGLFIIGALSFVMAFSGCRSQSSKVQTPVTLEASVEIPAELKTYDSSPKVDILFVIDYSTSMLRHQENLAKNIKAFVAAFENNKTIDFHIAVVPIWDTYHFTEGNPYRHVYTPQYKMGELLPLKDPNSAPCDYKNDPACHNTKVLDGPRFITRDTPQYLTILERTLLMGEDYGPAYEETFSPVFPALTGMDLVTKKQVPQNSVNAGFFRDPTTNLIVVFVTDSDDRTDRLSPGDLYNALVGLKNGDADLVSIVGVLSPSNEPSCPKDEGAPKGPARIEELLRLAHSENFELSLCSKNFGEKLAQIGSDLSVKVKRQSIYLEHLPDFNPNLPEDKVFKVLYGGQVIQPAQGNDLDNGWSYDGQRQRVVIGSKTALDVKPGAHFQVQYTPISFSQIVNGRVNKN